jgi:hypothetical protein
MSSILLKWTAYKVIILQEKREGGSVYIRQMVCDVRIKELTILTIISYGPTIFCPSVCKGSPTAASKIGFRYCFWKLVSFIFQVRPLPSGNDCEHNFYLPFFYSRRNCTSFLWFLPPFFCIVLVYLSISKPTWRRFFSNQRHVRFFPKVTETGCCVKVDWHFKTQDE